MNTQETINYEKTDLMRNLISENYFMQLVINGFHISFEFGKKTIDEICKLNNVDTNKFLVVANRLLKHKYLY